MAVGNKIKSAMATRGKRRRDLATALNISDKAITAKFYRDSFSAEDLIKIANCLGYSLYLESEDTKISFNLRDIKVGVK
jgi:transcriptional regulator with XRE-family HTH domain